MLAQNITDLRCVLKVGCFFVDYWNVNDVKPRSARVMPPILYL